MEDLGSRNGIKLNKKRTRKATIKDRDELEIGGVRLLFIDPSEVREDPVVMSSSQDDEEEGTLANKPEDDPPSVEVKQEEEPAADAPAEEEPAAEEPADEPQKTEDDPPAEEEPAQEQEEEEEPADEGPRKLVDFSNKQHLVALGVGGAMVLVGVVLIILLVAGA